MAHDVIKISYQPLILVGAGVVPTVPAISTDVPGDAGWVQATDLLIGQTAYNVTDNLFYIRKASGIVILKDTMSYVHDQGTPSATWTITHNLGFYPSVTAVNTGLEICIGAVTYLTLNSLQIEFNGGFSGKAFLT